MMYVAHDAFRRDLTRLVAAADAGQVGSPEAVSTWDAFSTQLHTHHASEDTALFKNGLRWRLCRSGHLLWVTARRRQARAAIGEGRTVDHVGGGAAERGEFVDDLFEVRHRRRSDLQHIAVVSCGAQALQNF